MMIDGGDDEDDNVGDNDNVYDAVAVQKSLWRRRFVGRMSR